MQEYVINLLTQPDKGWSLISIPFAVVFIVFFLIYIFLRHSTRWLMLSYVTVFGLFFAYKANGVLMLLLPVTVLVSYFLTERMRKEEGKRRKALMWITIVLELAPLIYYKYTNFLLDIVSDITSSNISPLSIILPVGISFYTFQAISYTVDVYKQRFTLDVSLLEYAFYLTFFPLLMAGPITRAETLIPQIKHRYHVNDTMVYAGLWLIMSGLLKKALIADYIAQYNNWIFDDPTAYSGFENLMGLLGYCLQIYCDFSGYSDISIGIASLMGITLKENFRFPYQSLNVQEFWRRWHISLSTWFRDYVYIPLGGNRKGEIRTYLNVFITMLIAGLWHGATWMFVIWGAMHGVAQVIHKACKPWLDKLPEKWWVKVAAFLITFLFINFAWVFFRAQDLDTALAMLRNIFFNCSFDYLPPFIETRTLWVFLVVAGFALHAVRQKHLDYLKEKYINSPITLKLILLFVVMQLVINLRQSDIQPFIYTQF